MITAEADVAQLPDTRESQAATTVGTFAARMLISVLTTRFFTKKPSLSDVLGNRIPVTSGPDIGFLGGPVLGILSFPEVNPDHPFIDYLSESNRLITQQLENCITEGLIEPEIAA